MLLFPLGFKVRDLTTRLGGVFRMVRGWALGHGPRVLCTLAHFARGSWPNGFGQTFPWFLPFN